MKFFRNPVLIIVSIMSVLAYNFAYADPGETDEKGGHYNRQTGEYHYHIEPEQNSQALRTLAAVELQATADAKRDISVDNVWFGYGLCCGVVAIGSAYIVTPTPPAKNLIGKSPEYIVFYTEAYQREMKKERAKAAAIGCGVGAGLYMLFSLVTSDN